MALFERPLRSIRRKALVCSCQCLVSSPPQRSTMNRSSRKLYTILIRKLCASIVRFFNTAESVTYKRRVSNQFPHYASQR
jgi:hypothetical protein